MQAIGGTIWHGIKGFRNSPAGERRIGALTAIKMRAPVLGGNFGVWGGLFSTFDCAVKGIRRKEDPYNAIIAGFFTGGSLAIRGGYKAARNGAIGCAVLLAVIEGVGIAFQKMMAGGTKLEVSFHACGNLLWLTIFATSGSTTSSPNRQSYGIRHTMSPYTSMSRTLHLSSSHETGSLFVESSHSTCTQRTELSTHRAAFKCNDMYHIDLKTLVTASAGVGILESPDVPGILTILNTLKLGTSCLNSLLAIGQ